MTGRPTYSPTGRPVFELPEQRHDLLRAWCVVLNSAPLREVRMLGIIGIDAFRGLDIIECSVCVDRERSPERFQDFTITAAVKHVTEHPGGGYHLALNAARYEVLR